MFSDSGRGLTRAPWDGHCRARASALACNGPCDGAVMMQRRQCASTLWAAQHRSPVTAPDRRL
eukprot:8595465-Pyramimonas_sp.AAC.1